MATLFISDLHLSGARAETIALFLRFLRERAASSEALYILGDLFEAWLGDDLVPPEYGEVLAALRVLTDNGVPVRIMRGNRDFLLGEAFARKTGCELLPEPATIELYGRRALLLHGDTLCTDDVLYQQMRTKLRHPAFMAAFLEKPAQERIAFARELRAKSTEETSRKEEYIMDVNSAAVVAAFHDNHADLIIHGHTHRPLRHLPSVEEGMGERIVLGDWGSVGSILVVEREGARLEEFA
jgi:UDP-2,3-diacylglucosamine hydrolase